MPTARRITARPITARRIVGRPIGVRGVPDAPPAPDYFVSSSATNGYSVGSDSNDGTSKSSPWLTVTNAISSAPSGSVVQINDGTYTAGTFYFLEESLTFVAENYGSVILKGSTIARVFYFRPSSGTHKMRAYGIDFDTDSASSNCVQIGISTSTADVSAEFYSCTFTDPTVRCLLTDSQKTVNVILKNCTASVSTGADVATLFDFRNPESGNIAIDGLSVAAASSYGSAKSVATVAAAGSGVSASISRVTGEYSTTSTTGGINGLVCTNVDGADIRNNHLTISGSEASGALYHIRSTSATLSANNGFIRNNRGANNTAGGYLALYGQDGSSDGDSNQNNGTISGNIMTANDSAATPIHGLMLGFGVGGSIHDNTVTGAGLATISKRQTGGEIYSNTINECNSEAIRAKGTNGTEWRNNTVNLSTGYAGDIVVVDADGATNSTGVTLDSNEYNIAAAPTKIVNVTTGSDASFTNNLYDIEVSLGADSWSYQGVNYQTLAEWKAAIEPTARP